MTIRDIKKGEYFTKKQIEEPTESQVWVKGDYCREAKKYFIHRFSDVNDSQLYDAKKPIYTDFYF